MAIPKQIHIVWIGDESKQPRAAIESWLRMNPGYTVRLWGNQDLLTSPWKSIHQIKAWAEREINGAADVMRWEILYRYGGLAVDADSYCVRPLEDWLLEPDCFAVWENEIARPGLIACGAMGCTPHHRLIGQILTDVLSDPDPTSAMAWEKVGPGRITKTVREYRYSDLTVYPSHYFIPRHFTGIQYQGAGPVFAAQLWGSTEHSYGPQFERDLPAVHPQAPRNLYRMTQEATVALAEGNREACRQLTAEILRAKPNDARAGELALQAAEPPGTPPGIVSRSTAGGFFLQRIAMGPSLAGRMKAILPLTSGKTVLHIGCVDSPIFDPENNLHLTLSKTAAELHGLDIDTGGLDELRRYFRGVYFSSVDQCLQRGAHYDVVLIPETIEHVPNAEQFLRDVDRISFDRVMITAPCIYGWSRYGVLSHREGDTSWGPYGWLLNPGSLIEEVHPDHKYWFSPYTLANLIESATDWKIESVQLLEDARQIAITANHGGRPTAQDESHAIGESSMATASQPACC